MSPEQIHLVRKSFQRVEAMGHVAALVFYQRLFELAPSVRPLFRDDIESQAEKLTDTLAAALTLAERPEQFRNTLRELGARHVEYGALPEHYPIVGAALLEMLATVVGDDFTATTREAWTALLEEISALMLEGAEGVPA